MKRLSKLLTVVMILAMILTLSVTALAAGDGSITVKNATLGQTYEAYLIFPASPVDPDDLSAGVSYTATPTQVAVTGFDGIFDTILDSSGNYTISKKTTVTDDEVIAFVKNNINSLKTGTAISGTYSNNSTYVFSNLDYGYYYITSTLGTMVTIDTAGKNVEVVDKNESQPTGPDKVITDEDSSVNAGLDQTGLSVTSNDAAVGSVESYKITFNATNWVQDEEANTAGTGTGTKTQVTKWNFEDNPGAGLTIAADSVKVYVNGADITTSVTDITVNAGTGVLTFSINWVDASGKSLYSATTPGSEYIPVTVTYNATVTDAAATAVATNTVTVKYNDTTTLGTDTTTTYTYKFDLNKVDENTNPLDGAKFELYYSADGTTATGDALKFTMVGDVYHYDPSGSVTQIAPTGAGASASIVGLDNATYILKEVVVPDGYNKAADTTVNTLSRVDAGTISTITVTNNKGTELPSTGGIGTTIFYIIGGVLVVGAGVLLITKKRMKANED